MNQHALLMAAAMSIIGLWGERLPAQPPGNWVSAVPAGRGYFARVEALWLKRDASDAAVLATLNSPGPGGRVNVLATEDVDYDFERGIRVLAGMMLNDCTQAEVEYFGIDSFEGNEATLVRPPGLFALNSIFTVLNQTPLAYRADGETELHNGEINLRRRGGYGRISHSVLVGFRYMHIRDRFQLDTFGPPPGNGSLAFESTSARTRNNIFGLQVGGDVGFHWDRFHLTTAVEGFVYGNAYESTARNVIDDPSGFFLKGPTFRDSSDKDRDSTAGVGAQVGVDAAINLTNNIILHGGYHVLALSDVALGAEQLPTVRLSPARGARASTQNRSDELGSLFFHGPSAGLEIRW